MISAKCCPLPNVIRIRDKQRVKYMPLFLFGSTYEWSDLRSADPATSSWTGSNFTGISFHILLPTLVTIVLLGAAFTNGQPWATTTWNEAHATFYGADDNSGTMGGACGHGDLYTQGYGVATAAFSDALFNDGLSCGACFQLVRKTEETDWCYSGQSITLTATNSCPEGSFGGWCDSPKQHFDLSHSMFTTLAQESGGVIPVKYMRVPCVKQGGVKFTFNGNPWYNNTLVWNIVGAGNVQAISLKGDNTDFLPMVHSWGHVFTLSTNLVGQGLTFRVTVGDAGFQKTMNLLNVAPPNWNFGQTFESADNFSF